MTFPTIRVGYATKLMKVPLLEPRYPTKPMKAPLSSIDSRIISSASMPVVSLLSSSFLPRSSSMLFRFFGSVNDGYKQVDAKSSIKLFMEKELIRKAPTFTKILMMLEQKYEPGPVHEHIVLNIHSDGADSETVENEVAEMGGASSNMEDHVHMNIAFGKEKHYLNKRNNDADDIIFIELDSDKSSQLIPSPEEQKVSVLKNNVSRSVYSKLLSSELPDESLLSDEKTSSQHNALQSRKQSPCSTLSHIEITEDVVRLEFLNPNDPLYKLLATAKIYGERYERSPCLLFSNEETCESSLVSSMETSSSFAPSTASDSFNHFDIQRYYDDHPLKEVSNDIIEKLDYDKATVDIISIRSDEKTKNENRNSTNDNEDKHLDYDPDYLLDIYDDIDIHRKIQLLNLSQFIVDAKNLVCHGGGATVSIHRERFHLLLQHLGFKTTYPMQNNKMLLSLSTEK